MKYLLGIDFGGSASKATLIDINGNIVAENSAEYPTLHPTPKACEQDPVDWINALCKNCKEILLKSKIDSADILAVAVDSATHTFIPCDENFIPLRNAIHWTDSRSYEQAVGLNKKYGNEIFDKCFHKPDTIWTLPQLIWYRENEPENFKKTCKIFFEKDYIRYFLTGVFCTDYIEAQGSMLFDSNKMCWDEKLCDFAKISIDSLPPVMNPKDIVGAIVYTASKATGLKEGTPVVCGTTDTALEVFASGSISKGDITVKLATAGRICVITDKAYPAEHLINYSHVVDGLWYPGTATKSCAESYRWLKNTFDGEYEELNHCAEKISIGCDGLIFHPYLNGELTPYADPMLCGSFTGIRSTHTKAHFTRAVLEGVAYSLLDSKLYLDSMNIPYSNVATAIGGGAKGILWRQMIADVLGITLKTTKSSDSSLGSAMLAGIAVGVFKDADEAVKKCVEVIDVTKPDINNTKKYAEIFKKYKKIHDALAPVYSEK